MIRIKSKIDVITNSSSEVFIFKKLPGDLRTIDEIRKDVEDYHKRYKTVYLEIDEHSYMPMEHPDPNGLTDSYSGDCQDIVIRSMMEKYKSYRDNYVPKLRRSEFTKDMYYIIHGFPSTSETDELMEIQMDQNFLATIDWFIKEFWVVEAGRYDWWKDENGRYTRRLTEQEEADMLNSDLDEDGCW